MRHRRVRRWSITAVWISVAIILGLEGYLLWQVRSAAWEMAIRSAKNVSATLSTGIDRNLKIVDLSLTGLQETVEGFDLSAMEPQLRNSTLFDRAASAEYLGTMLVLSRDGDVLFDNAGWPPRQGNFADRDYFRAHLDGRRGTYLSPPYFSRLRGGDPSIALSRRWSDARGGFNGVLVGAVRLAYFSSLFSGVNLGPLAAVSIMRADGTLLMRVPSSDGTGNVGLDLRGSPVFQHIQSGAGGSFTARSTVDGVERSFVFDKIGDFPLYLIVGFSNGDVLESWIPEAATILGLGLVACTIIIALFISLQRVLDRQLQVESDLARLATTDVLTGLSNRRYFDDMLAREWERARRNRAPLSLLIIDVDHFKAVNDGLGHAAGDGVLRAIGEAIGKALLRPGDLAARYGGDEFAVLLSDTDGKGALTVATRIRGRIGDLGLGTRHGLAVAGTVSIGIATIRVAPDTTASIDSLFRASDRALYIAKRAGRDRVETLENVEGEGAAPDGGPAPTRA